jgi:hypothetical protein
MRLLLVTLYYPPLNTIAALRLKAFEKYLSEAGNSVDVITRYYDEEQQKGQSMFLGCEPSKDFSQSYIKIDNVLYTNFDKRNSKLSFSERLPPIIKGIYNYTQVDVFHYGWIKYIMEGFEVEFKKNKYDYIIGSYGPPITMLAVKQLAEKYNIPYIIDFRDILIDEKDKIHHLFFKKKMQYQMLKKAAALIFSTEGMRDYFYKNANNHLRKIPSCIVYNGVEEKQSAVADISDGSIVAQFDNLQSKSTMLLLHTGTLYKGQNILFFINSVEEYNKQHKQNCVIVFLGLAENRIDYIPSKKFIHYLPKVKHATALYLQKRAEVLLLPIWDGRYTGFSGKTQEYLFSENFVITSPNPQKDLNEFFDISPNVYIANDYKTFKDILFNIYSGKYIKSATANKEKLLRSYWIKKMSSFLLELK